MVKVGPKLPPPSKRELEKAENEAKRLADAASGVEVIPQGELRTNLIRLLHVPIRKKRRVKPTDPAAIEESKRRREKKEERALARRNTKAIMKGLLHSSASSSSISSTHLPASNVVSEQTAVGSTPIFKEHALNSSLCGYPQSPKQGLIQSPALVSCLDGTSRPFDMYKSARALGKRRAAESGADYRCNFPLVAAHGFTSPGALLIQDDHESVRPIQSGHLRVGARSPVHTVRQRQIDLYNTEYSRIYSPAVTPSAYNQASAQKSLVTPYYVESSSHLGNSISFSSNFSSALGNEYSALLPGETPVREAVNQNAKDAHPMLNVSSTVPFHEPPSSAPLVVDMVKPSRWLPTVLATDFVRNVDIFDQLEKGIYDLDSEAFDDDELVPELFSTPDEVTGCIRTPNIQDLRSGIIPPTGTPVSRSPLIHAYSMDSSRFRSEILPMYGTHVDETNVDEEGGVQGFMSALKWALRRTIGYFWQRRGLAGNTLYYTLYS